jgi:hypothetical protein
MSKITRLEKLKILKQKFNSGINLEGLRLTTEYVHKIAEKIKHNEKIISAYYSRLYDETNNGRFLDIADNVRDCSKSWFFDVYKMQRIKDLKSVFLCKNKFCLNCQKLIQKSRLERFAPYLDDISRDYDLYHLVFTIPNCNGENLKQTINRLFKAFKNLIRYFKLNSFVKDVDFARYGYAGSIRSLETTYKFDDYHPHIHSIFAFKKDLDFKKNIKNVYSYSKFSDKIRFFSDFEILIQKIWYLNCTGQRVNLKNIDIIPEGYSCTADRVTDGDYYEVFKYATKIYEETSNLISYEQFKVFYTALYNRRTIQGYGVFYNISVDDSIDEGYIKAYEDIITKLKAIEDPVLRHSSIDKLLYELYDGGFTHISRRNIDAYFTFED